MEGPRHRLPETAALIRGPFWDLQTSPFASGIDPAIAVIVATIFAEVIDPGLQHGPTLSRPNVAVVVVIEVSFESGVDFRAAGLDSMHGAGQGKGGGGQDHEHGHESENSFGDARVFHRFSPLGLGKLHFRKRRVGESRWGEG